MMYIELTALSDLCPGSGIGRGADIDKDICFDTYGIPYIPAKRVKGCLREAAEFCAQLDARLGPRVNELFGTVQERGHLCISNAHVPDYEHIVACMSAASQEEKALLDREQVIDTFCALRKQTAIDKDGAKEKSLRTTRVVKRGVAFEIPVTCPDEYIDDLRMFLKAWRSIGSGVTRGFGRIQVKLAQGKTENRHVPICSCEIVEGKRYSLEYLLYLEQDVLISGEGTDAAQDSIPGAAIRGCVSNAYMTRHPGKRDYSDDPDFRALFLSGSVQYRPCRVSSARATVFLPSPASLMYTKGNERALVDFATYQTDKDESIEAEEKKKPMLGRYIHRCGVGEVEVCRAALRMNYHHAVNGKTAGDLFRYQAIAKGQFFLGEIIADGEGMKKLRAIFEGLDHFRIGRSRTAEYGLVRIRKVTIAPKPVEMVTGNRFVAVLQTPVCLMDASGIAQQGGKALLSAIAGKATSSSCCELKDSFLQRTRLGGYNVQWRLAKPTVHAFDTGTTLVFATSEETSFPSEVSVGGMQSTGCGVVRIARYEDIPSRLSAVFATDSETPSPAEACAAYTSLLEKLHWKERERNLIRYALEHRFANGLLNSTLCGKLDMMLLECASLGAYRGNIEKIENEKKRKTVLDLLFEQAPVSIPAAFQACGADVNDWTLVKSYVHQQLALCKFEERRAAR